MMKNITMLSAIGALVVAGGLGIAHAATETTTSGTGTSKIALPFVKADGDHIKVRGIKGFGKDNTELLTLLKLDEEGLKTQLQAGKSLAEIAEAQGVSKDSVIELIKKQNNERIDQAVTDGKLTAEQAAELKAQFDSKVAEMIEKTGIGVGKGGFGKGHRGFFHSEELHTLLKLDEEGLKTQLQAGKSLAEIAEAQGVSKDSVIELIKKQNNERIDQAVTDGKLTAEQAAEMKTQFDSKVAELIEQKGFAGGKGKGGFGKGKGGFGKGRDGKGTNSTQQPQESTTTTSSTTL
ncbi:hypothetical protein [Brevibacillus dissolubilis]|uniref:hypothetical protein n=1 Tax=Brevibacillus dissolubilis TaxID=1844116 RepID=UPI001116BB0D|nr:hypothetical protein [Brevibacillus dissolubilis]